MNSNDMERMTLDMPASWDTFGQWLVYAIIIGMVLAVLVIMFKVMFPKKDNEDSDSKD